ncbi:MAG: Uma2 family endonuclease [Candidatus Viridilinea halotolerans]|uniref:Uma2 family endonuclease n=1 Tax=Candidatus Viridilinea halotolerans TaxID=2491704 RepID=A0A426TT26_9CHLR|nr:MAG: Uma2 family endonuclease [Candidatus Viridilinea halotolerans]
MTTTPDLLMRSLDTTWDYERWEQLPDDDRRYEVIDGILYMTTAPSSFHQWIIRMLDRHIGTPAELRSELYVLTAPIGLLMPGCDPVQPDFLLVRRERAGILADRRVRGVPDLIAEVLSPNNAEQDTEIKRAAYARAGVPEYWIVRPATRDVLVCWQPDQALGTYTQERCYAAGEQLVAATFAGVAAPVDALFAGAPDTTL